MKLPRKVSKWTIIHYRQKNPCLTGASIARKFSISRERVRQILSDADRSTVSNHYGSIVHCTKCGKHLGYSKACPEGVCRDCYHEAHTVTLICSVCGKTFERPQSQYLLRNVEKDQQVYCSNECKWGVCRTWLTCPGRPPGSKNRSKN